MSLPPIQLTAIYNSDGSPIEVSTADGDTKQINEKLKSAAQGLKGTVIAQLTLKIRDGQALLSTRYYDIKEDVSEENGVQFKLFFINEDSGFDMSNCEDETVVVTKTTFDEKYCIQEIKAIINKPA
ncbi:hypothetical protein D5018_00125 [Parashewanella curva]|uniref:Uncharacterized protein n=1 Tax=Parashewanella curva TaxID=2338552 RepID=A0A3L8Q1Q2_9GAMM|nr:hypothetical protein [Parashewanella curva]RLV61561.1 hypothetical protein D5018_00125 [Parashewanella curva]